MHFSGQLYELDSRSMQNTCHSDCHIRTLAVSMPADFV